MPRIPHGLKPIVSGYSIGDPGGVLRTEVAGGRSRYALDWDRGAQLFNVTMVLDGIQFSVWSVFYAHAIKKGAITFELELDSGLGVQYHDVNIVPDSYSADRDGPVMIVSFVVEAESQVYALSAADAQGLLDLYAEYGRGAVGLFDALHKFANVDSTVLDF